MPILLIVFCEVLLFGYFSDRFGFLRTLGAYWIPTFILAGFIPVLLSLVQNLTHQSMDTSGKSLNRQLNRLLLVLGFVALIIPLVTTRLIGAVLVLPGFRHLILWKFKSTVQKKTNQYFGQFGNGNGFQFYYQRNTRTYNPGFENFEPGMKDVTPSKPEQVPHTPKIASPEPRDPEAQP